MTKKEVIKALEQQTDDDCISRQAATDVLYKTGGD